SIQRSLSASTSARIIWAWADSGCARVIGERIARAPFLSPFFKRSSALARSESLAGPFSVSGEGTLGSGAAIAWAVGGAAGAGALGQTIRISAATAKKRARTPISRPKTSWAYQPPWPRPPQKAREKIGAV